MPATALEYVCPASLDAALGLLHRDGTRVVAGGTAVILRLSPDVHTLVDLRELGLDTITASAAEIRIGAMATLTDVLETEAIAGLLDGYVAGMLRRVGSPLLRNLATMGGHIARGRLSDIIPVLLTLDTRVVVFDGGHTYLPLQEYLDRGAGESGTILTEVVIPQPAPGTAAEFLKFARTSFDLAMLNCACLLRIDDRHISAARVVVGETPKLGVRLAAVEDHLTGKAATRSTIAEASALARTTVETGTDLRATADYRRQLAHVAVMRCLTAVIKRLGVAL